MKKTLPIFIIIIIPMGLLSFFKKEKKAEPSLNTTLLGMILLEEPDSFPIDLVADELKNKWNLTIDSIQADKEIFTLEINGYLIAIANMPVAIPTDEVKMTARFNYFWKNGVEEVSKHKGHIILSITRAGKNPVQENLLFSKVASAVMDNTKSMGIYIGGRNLVLKKDFYQSNVKTMSEEYLPLYIWVYFGLAEKDGKQSIYTSGLTDFGKKEMEIVDSDKSAEELSEMMFNLAHYVIEYNVNLKSGETIGLSAEQKLSITESMGKFQEGTTLKIEY